MESTGAGLYCSVPGRHKPNGPHYYPALLKPVNYNMPGCDHEDILHYKYMSTSPTWYLQNLRHLISSPNETQYKKQRLQTGITKPTIFLGIASNCIFSIPRCFGSDVMHLGTFNLADLFLSLCGRGHLITTTRRILSRLGLGLYCWVSMGAAWRCCCRCHSLLTRLF